MIANTSGASYHVNGRTIHTYIPSRYSGRTEIIPKRHGVTMCTGAIALFGGIACIGLNIALIAINTDNKGGSSFYFPNIGYGIWGGILFIFSGSAVNKAKTCTMPVFILSISSSIVSLVGIGLTVATLPTTGQKIPVCAAFISVLAVEFLVSVSSFYLFLKTATHGSQNGQTVSTVPKATYAVRPSSKSHSRQNGLFADSSDPSPFGGIFGIPIDFYSPSDISGGCHSSADVGCFDFGGGGCDFSGGGCDFGGGGGGGGGCDSGGGGCDSGGGV